MAIQVLNPRIPPFRGSPAGAINAPSRHQTEDKYHADFELGYACEWAVYAALQARGIRCSEPDQTQGQNLHTADIVTDCGYQYHVKGCERLYGGQASWVFQNSALYRFGKPVTKSDKDRVALVFRNDSEFTIMYAFPWNLLFHPGVLEPLKSAMLRQTKSAVYANTVSRLIQGSEPA